MATLVVGTGPGATFDNFEAAVLAASAGDTIELQDGVINLEDPGAADGQVFIGKDLTVVGQGQGTTTLVSVADAPFVIALPAAPEDGEPFDPRPIARLAPAINIGGDTEVRFSALTFDAEDFWVSSAFDIEGASAEFSDVTITDVQRGLASTAGISVHSGGQVVVTNAIFHDLTRGISAGSMSHVSVSGSTFDGRGEGPSETFEWENYGISVGGGTADISDSVFRNYSITVGPYNGSYESGAAISATNASVTLDASSFTDNYTGVLATNSALDVRPGNTFLSTIPTSTGSRPASGLYLVSSSATGTADVSGSGATIFFYGGTTNDTVEGGPVNDRLFGDDGGDFIAGNGGDDDIDGGMGTDTARYSGNRADYRFGILPDGGLRIVDERPGSPDGADTVRDIDFLQFADALVPFAAALEGAEEGSRGPDNVVLGTADDEFAGRGGDDTVYGNVGNDALFGDEGDDTLYGEQGDDRLVGGSGDDVLSGGEGDDILGGGDGNDILVADSGNDLLLGESGNDLLIGGTGNDRMDGGTGNDTLGGGGGNDLLQGGEGNDALYGETGDDALIGATGDDLLAGGEGRDVLDGGSGNDQLFGGAGDDLFIIAAGSDTALGEAGSDTFRFDPGFGGCTIKDFEHGPLGTDKAALTRSMGFASFDELMASPWVYQEGDNTAINYFGSGAFIILENVTKTNLVADDFIFL